MKSLYRIVALCALGAIFLIPSHSFAQSVVFSRSLKIGDHGADVLLLQKMLNVSDDTRIARTGVGSPGQESGIFGARTKIAVRKFQDKYAEEVLTSGQSATGVVGPRTIKKLHSILSALTKQTSVAIPTTQTTLFSTTTTVSTHGGVPVVLDVSPKRVKAGETITIIGKNFSSTGNTVTLRDGVIVAQFYNLLSGDGQTLSFVYTPPTLHIPTKNQLLALPAGVLAEIKKPLDTAGLTLDTITDPYKGIKSESELNMFLKSQGHSVDDLAHYFYITVANSNGAGSSKAPLVYGARKIELNNTVAQTDSGLMRVFEVIFDRITPKANAQIPYGGYNSGFLFPCTCGGGYMTFMMDLSPFGGSNLYWIYPGFVPISGEPEIAGPFVGKYIPGAGVCLMYAGLGCFDIPGNIPSAYPWGEAQI